ncbi:MAG TPA: hypothetical protein DCY94_02525, partial [Firmicutes bacterium]|nr:hypothetical protein [Bacillota bacterium]
LGLDTNGLDKRFEELKKYMGLSFDGVYELSSFVNRDNNEGVKLELKFIDRSNGQSIDKSFSLVRESGFIGFEKRAGDVISSISIRGNVSNTFTIQKTDAESVYNFTLRNKDGKREGALSIVGKSTNETKVEATFSYKIDKTTNTSYTMESSLELKNYETNGGAVYIIDSSIIINGKNEVEASRKIEDSITLDAYEKEANVVFSEKFKSMMRSISIADIAPPQVFTPEMSGNVPSQ